VSIPAPHNHCSRSLRAARRAPLDRCFSRQSPPRIPSLGGPAIGSAGTCSHDREISAVVVCRKANMISLCPPLSCGLLWRTPGLCVRLGEASAHRRSAAGEGRRGGSPQDARRRTGIITVGERTVDIKEIDLTTPSTSKCATASSRHATSGCRWRSERDRLTARRRLRAGEPPPRSAPSSDPAIKARWIRLPGNRRAGSAIMCSLCVTETQTSETR